MARPKASGDFAKVAHTISITARARALADDYIQKRGFEEGIPNFSAVVERALIAYCSRRAAIFQEEQNPYEATPKAKKTKVAL